MIKGDAGMIIKEQILNDPDNSIFYDKSLEYPVFMNIETTGLYPRSAFIFLIGLMYIANGKITVKTYIAESRMEERGLLETVRDSLSACSLLAAFGGQSFSFRFLRKRWDNYSDEDFFCFSLSDSNDPAFAGLELFDLQKMISQLSFMFDFENVKKSYLENKTGFIRKLALSGEELVSVYTKYESRAALIKEDNSDCIDLLMEHNLEDMRSLLHFYRFTAYKRLLHGDFHVDRITVCDNSDTASSVKGTSVCEFRLATSFDFPYPASYNTEYAVIDIGMEIKVRVWPYHGKLKYFLPVSHKDYYYLPVEDMAVHKSVGEFVDKKFRKKATPATCYINREGLFLPCPDKSISPHFQESYKSKPYYIELTEEMIDKPEALHAYLMSVFA